MPAEKKKNIYEYDAARTIAIILVVLGHSFTFTFNSSFGFTDISSASYLVSDFLYKLIYSFHMPLFVMLSGALFLRSAKKREPSDFFKNKFKRLLVPYLFVGLVIWLPLRFAVGYYSCNYAEALVWNVLLGIDINYLWFLFMLFCVTMFFYFLLRKFESKVTKFSWPVFIILLAINIIALRLPDMAFQINRILVYLLWFYVGIQFGNNLDKFKTLIARNRFVGVAVPVLFLVLFSFDYLFVSNGLSVTSGLLLLVLKICSVGLDFLLSLIGCLSVLCIVEMLPSLDNRRVKWISNVSFDIYLLSVPVQYLLRMAFYLLGLFSTLNVGEYYALAVFAQFVCALIISMALSVLKSRAHSMIGIK